MKSIFNKLKHINENAKSSKNFKRQVPFKTKTKILGIIFLLPWIIGLVMFFIYPFFTTVWYSLNSVRPLGGKLEIQFLGLGNYKYIFNELVYFDKTFIRVMWESLQILLINLPIILIFSLLIATMLNSNFRGRPLVRMMFFIPVILNSNIIEIVLKGSFSMVFSSSSNGSFLDNIQFENYLIEVGIGQSFITFLLASIARILTIVNLSGVQILIFLSAIQAIPNHLYEAAEIEGATKYETFWKITFPLVSPLFLTVIIYTIVDSFIDSPVMQFIEYSRDNLRYYGLSSAISILFFITNMILLFIIFLVIRKEVFSYDDKN
ncbi:MAG: putative carbohydrate transporter-like,permease [Haloplasmataceae bacterium]|nr:putative carbohydrate transporter-like,permease [Haloplasmataceae bacterium]